MVTPRVGPLRLVELMGEWSSGTAPLYLQLARSLQRLIDEGDLRPGTRLPAERSLATTLAVSRTTVVTALDHLKQRGYMESAPGSGTWVRTVRGFNPSGGVSTPADTVGRNPLYSRLGAEPDAGMLDLTASVLSPSPLVRETLTTGRWTGLDLDSPGYYPAGWPPLREAVADWFTRRGLATTSEQVLVTGGGQQAVMLVAAAYLQPGDPVVVESPTFPGALDAFRLLGASVRTVPVSADGASADDVKEAIDARKPCLTYLIPTYQNPTGSVMTQLERKRLARYLAERNTVLVEDEALVELPLDGAEPPPPLAAYHEQSLVLGSASKPYWGGLRIGWIRGPVEAIRRLRHYKTVFDLGAPVPTQAAACLLFERADEILAERTQQLRGQHDALSAALKEALPEWRWDRPAGGLNLWVRLPGGSATELAQVALRHGVAVVPGPFFDPQSHHDSALRLPFVLTPSALGEAVARLARAWDQYRGLGNTSASRPA